MKDIETNPDAVVVETTASDSIKTKADAKSDFIARMQGKRGDDVTKLSAQFSTVDKNDAAAKDTSASNKATLNMKPSDASPKTATWKEDISSIFGDDAKDLSEDFLDKASTLFESAVNVQASAIRDELYEDAAAIVQDMVNEQVAEITENLDDYLNYVIAEWVEENKVAIESSLKAIQLESFFDGLKNLFTEHNLDLPEDSVDVVESLTAEIDELKGQLDEQINKNIENQKIIDEALRDQAFDEISEDLVATQREKLRALCEGLEAADIEEFRKKVVILKEHHFKTAPASTEIMKESAAPTAAPVQATGVMSKYAEAISKNQKYAS